jgi:hypothetical protein
MRVLFELFRSFKHLGIMCVLWFLGRRSCKQHARDALSPAAAREETFRSIVAAVAPSAFGKSMGLLPTMSQKEFQERIRLTTHAEVELFVRRIVEEDDRTAMSTLRMRQIGTTSGTSGTIKLIPMVAKQATIFFTQGVCPAFYRMFQDVPGSSFSLQRSCKLMWEPNFTLSKGGMAIGPNSSAPSNSRGAMCMYSSPASVYAMPLSQHAESVYLHAFHALKDPALGMLEGNFASLVCELLQCVEKNFLRLMDDLRATGEVARARTLEECLSSNKGSFVGIVPLFWPKLYAVLTCDTGAMELYGRMLRAYLGPKIPVFTPFLAATEGLIGIATSVSEKTFEPCFRAMYHEFVAEEHSDKEQPPTTPLEELRVGACYELVLTTFSGLVRYRIGDVVTIVATQPLKFAFSHRRGTIIDLRGEKCTEKQLFAAVSRVLGAALVDYTCVHHLQLEKGQEAVRYHIVAELKEEEEGGIESSKAAAQLDEELCQACPGYRYHRVTTRTLEPLELHVVAPGTFAAILSYLRNNKYPPNQLKIPRLERRPEVIQLLFPK